jgi:hypothetical protein
MSSMTAPVRRSGGDLDVYTGLLFAASLVLLAGVLSVASANIAQVETSTDPDLSLQVQNELNIPGLGWVKSDGE